MEVRRKKVISTFLLSSSSDSEDDEEYFVMLGRKPLPKIEKFIEEVINKLDDMQFKKYLRVERETAEFLINQFEHSDCFPEKQLGGRSPITAQQHILSFLWFAGNKSSMQDVAQRFGMTVSSFFRIMERVMNFLIQIGKTIIKMPNSTVEKEHLESEFKKVAGFPGVLGCIDGTSIPIRTPSKKIKSTYVNRHDIPSINLQGICNHRKCFIDVFTGIPGKVHDARMLKMSDISKNLPNICDGNKYHILGDGAYYIREWLLTPYKDYGSLTAEQNIYNKKFSATRVSIENTFGILKGRFRQLLKLDMHTVLKVTKFILSCCILHNLCIDFDDFIDENDIVNDDDSNDSQEHSRETEYLLRKRGEEKRDFIKTSFRYANK